MTRCARCTWTPDRTDDAPPDREQARGHALDWAHPLCSMCARSLPDSHPAVCEPCIQRTQETLAGVILLWQELPSELGQVRAQVYDRDGRGGGDEHTLPGGTVLALLAPGSAGGAARRLTDSDLNRLATQPIRWWVLGAYGPLTAYQWSLSQNDAEGREHVIDNRPDDAPSVAWTLTSWENEWREAREEEPAPHRSSTTRVVLAAAGYLERHTRWAATSHDAFAEYAQDLTELHARLEQATGRQRRPVPAGASCFDCGGRLVRPLREETGEAVYQWWLPGAVGPKRLAEMPEPHREGLVESEAVVQCQACRQTYDPARYLLALAARRQQGLDGWVPYRAAATAARRPVPTLWSWVQRLQVTAVCRVADRATLVWYPDVDARATRRKNDTAGAA